MQTPGLGWHFFIPCYCATRMPRNILVTGLAERCINFVVEDGITVECLRRMIEVELGISPDMYFMARGGSPLEDLHQVVGDGEDFGLTIVTAYPTLLGGKGGFGSLIRAMGTHINRSGNKNACRDLSGRRVRDVKAEEKIAEWVKGEPERKRVKEEKRKKRLRARRSEPKHFFNDPEYMEQLHRTAEEMDDALKQGLAAGSSSSSSDRGVKRKGSSLPHTSKKSKMLFGVDEEFDSDITTDTDSDSSDGGASVSEGNGEEGRRRKCHDGDDSGGSDSNGGGPGSTPSEQGEKEEGEEGGERKGTTDEIEIEQAGCSSSTSRSKSSTSPLVVASKDKLLPESEGERSEVSEGKGPGASKGGSTVETCEKKEEEYEPICLDDFASAEELEVLDPLRLKKALQALGVKCGGTPRERAARLFATKGKKAEELDPSMFAKPRRKRK